MRGCGKMDSGQGRENRYKQMEESMKDCGVMVKNTAKALSTKKTKNTMSNTAGGCSKKDSSSDS